MNKYTRTWECMCVNVTWHYWDDITFVEIYKVLMYSHVGLALYNIIYELLQMIVYTYVYVQIVWTMTYWKAISLFPHYSLAVQAKLALTSTLNGFRSFL